MPDATDLDTGQVKSWRSIVTLLVFVITNVIVLFPFHVPIYLPRALSNAAHDALSTFRIIPRRQKHSQRDSASPAEPPDDPADGSKLFMRFSFPMNFVTAPLIADLFLLAILAIGQTEVHDGTVGTNNIFPIDIMAFFLTLAYIAISIDASGIIRYLAFKVLQKAGKNGPRLFLYLYIFFFGLASFIGNDPIILSGTAFLAYMTRVSSNIKHPRAWIHTQFAVANIGSAILVTSNPTNLVLAGAFDIKFIHYTANIIVPVVATTVLLFPFLLWIVFPSEEEIPPKIELHELPESLRGKAKTNPNIPYVRENAEREENVHGQQGKQLSLEEIVNPFLDKGGAAFGAVIMAATLITIVALNAASQSSGEHPVYWVTLPAAFVMFCWDVAFGWIHRSDTRKIAREGRQRAIEAQEEARRTERQHSAGDAHAPSELDLTQLHSLPNEVQKPNIAYDPKGRTFDESTPDAGEDITPPASDPTASHSPRYLPDRPPSTGDVDEKGRVSADHPEHERATLESLIVDIYRWLQETFPTATAVAAHLPFALVPFALSMFVLVQALVTRGWVPVFAHGWDHWVNKTGTVGAIGGMGFLSVIMCNHGTRSQLRCI
ncbi:hypothetical protein LTR36_009877 [Oleoguttula mirabilis]|uniref:Citrate transporter-like domain-containing protein n=1 Tax=Oleoguttula mirabilis TaxID=1507867 RepID=A0AAV9J4T3_9PEZI|nr:hypothetical protein LTR36_009877 [Oleoguttula mirabilis]